MEYLAGQLKFKMDRHSQNLDQWPEFLVGPGIAPTYSGLPQPAPLQMLLPAPMYLPIDPWGGAYIFRKDPEKNIWLIQCQGDQPSTNKLGASGFAQYEILPPGS